MNPPEPADSLDHETIAHALDVLTLFGNAVAAVETPDGHHYRLDFDADTDISEVVDGAAPDGPPAILPAGIYLLHREPDAGLWYQAFPPDSAAGRAAWVACELDHATEAEPADMGIAPDTTERSHQP